jgi:hypothetical protein
MRQGLLTRATPPPAVVLLEMEPRTMAKLGYPGGPLALLRRMHAWGYTDVSHSGCARARLAAEVQCPEAESSGTSSALACMALCSGPTCTGVFFPETGCPRTQGPCSLWWSCWHGLLLTLNHAWYLLLHPVQRDRRSLLRLCARRHVCDERWHNITRSIRLRGAMALAAQEALRQPTWCTLPADKFSVLAERASHAAPENILFVYKARAPAPLASEGVHGFFWGVFFRFSSFRTCGACESLGLGAGVPGGCVAASCCCGGEHPASCACAASMLFWGLLTRPCSVAVLQRCVPPGVLLSCLCFPSRSRHPAAPPSISRLPQRQLSYQQ